MLKGFDPIEPFDIGFEPEPEPEPEGLEREDGFPGLGLLIGFPDSEPGRIGLELCDFEGAGLELVGLAVCGLEGGWLLVPLEGFFAIESPGL